MAEMSFFAFLIVLALVGLTAFTCFVIGYAVKTGEVVKRLHEKGWTIEPPKENE